MSTGDRSADRDPLDLLAEEFVARYRRGERPALAEYVEGYPELAEQIQELFPALVMMEQIKPAESNLAPNPPGGSVPARFNASPDRTVRRFPDPSGTRPRRDGSCLRGDPGIARPARRAQGPATTRPARPDPARPFPPRGPRRRPVCTTPTSCQSSPWVNRMACRITRCSSSAGKVSTRFSTS